MIVGLPPERCGPTRLPLSGVERRGRGPKARARARRNKASQILSTFCKLRIGYFCSTGQRLALRPCGRDQNRWLPPSRLRTLRKKQSYLQYRCSSRKHRTWCQRGVRPEDCLRAGRPRGQPRLLFFDLDPVPGASALEQTHQRRALRDEQGIRRYFNLQRLRKRRVSDIFFGGTLYRGQGVRLSTRRVIDPSGGVVTRQNFFDRLNVDLAHQK